MQEVEREDGEEVDEEEMETDGGLGIDDEVHEGGVGAGDGDGGVVAGVDDGERVFAEDVGGVRVGGRGAVIGIGNIVIC